MFREGLRDIQEELTKIKEKMSTMDRKHHSVGIIEEMVKHAFQ